MESVCGFKLSSLATNVWSDGGLDFDWTSLTLTGFVLCVKFLPSSYQLWQAFLSLLQKKHPHRIILYWELLVFKWKGPNTYAGQTLFSNSNFYFQFQNHVSLSYLLKYVDVIWKSLNVVILLYSNIVAKYFSFITWHTSFTIKIKKI